jgi:hypothetical protein
MEHIKLSNLIFESFRIIFQWSPIILQLWDWWQITWSHEKMQELIRRVLEYLIFCRTVNDKNAPRYSSIGINVIPSVSLYNIEHVMLKRIYRQQTNISKRYRHKFDPISFRVVFVVDRRGTGACFSAITSVFPMSLSRHIWSVPINSSSKNTI